MVSAASTVSPFWAPGCLVMGTDYRAIEKDHAEGLISVFNLFKEALPHTEFRPSNEQLCRNPPGINSDGGAPHFVLF